MSNPWRSEATTDPDRVSVGSSTTSTSPIGLETGHRKIADEPVQILSTSMVRRRACVWNLYALSTPPLHIFLAPSISALGLYTQGFSIYDAPASVIALTPGMFIETATQGELWAVCPETTQSAPVDLWLAVETEQ